MGAYTCEYGFVHKTCRCRDEHKVKCDNPQEHNPAGSEVTQSGRWVHKDANIHRCNKPGYDKSIKIGDRWQCNACDKVWRVNGFDSGVQWDPYPTRITWAEVTDYNGIYAPGTK